MNKTLVIGTRGSALALWQAEHVQALYYGAGQR
jgi:porphobilinogen deaminase